MSKNDIDVGIMFQKEELKELITAIDFALTITDMLAPGWAERTPYMRKGADLLTMSPHPFTNKTVKDMLESWENENMGGTISAHLNVLREVIDNETN
mgnify:CR=1 FL=1